MKWLFSFNFEEREKLVIRKVKKNTLFRCFLVSQKGCELDDTLDMQLKHNLY